MSLKSQRVPVPVLDGAIFKNNRNRTKSFHSHAIWTTLLLLNVYIALVHCITPSISPPQKRGKCLRRVSECQLSECGCGCGCECVNAMLCEQNHCRLIMRWFARFGWIGLMRPLPRSLPNENDIDNDEQRTNDFYEFCIVHNNARHFIQHDECMSSEISQNAFPLRIANNTPPAQSAQPAQESRN